ncbi:MAG TPA: TonB-dependent receptor [Steroidobacteraceae bacterium]|nr:TonB-dependent receptor [Steroidobacteraceae bacterium]
MQNKHQRRQKYPAAASVCIGALIALAPNAAFAQTAPANSSTEELDVVTVTGSRIKRPNIESASPVAVIDTEELVYQGTTSVETALNRLPQFTADSNENGSNGSDGTARLNLRGIGSGRVLVLVDGQRMLPVETADVNFIPSSLLERVDVVTGGASAVYGSDAVAGVVNFIMKKDLHGVRVDAQYGIANHSNDNSYVRSVVDSAGFALPESSLWDGARTNVNMSLGMNTEDGKGNVTFYLGYRELDPVTQDTRDYSACGLNLTGTGNSDFVCGGSSNNQWGLFTALNGPSQNTTFNNVKDGSATWVPYDSSFLYNYAPTNYIQRQDKRITAGAFAHYNYSENAEIYGSLMFMDDHTFSQAAPSAYFQGTVYPINCDNPLMSAQQAGLLCGAQAGTPTNINTFIGYRFGGEGGPRRDDLRHTDYRVNIGTRGDFAEGWSYDVSALFSQMMLDESYKNDLDPIKGARGLQVVDVGGVPTCRSVVDGTDPNCVPVNVFQAFGISPEAYGYIFTPTFTHGVQKESVLNAVINGDLDRYGIRLPTAAEAVAIAVGVEHRTEDLTFEADAVAQSKGTRENEGDFKVDEAFLEVDVPLVNDKPGIHMLSLNAGYRYSDYSVAGGTGFKADTYKAELQYSPIQALKFRGSFNRAVRAPNISELFAAQALGNVSGQDPCSGPNPISGEADCARSGVTPALYRNIQPCPADTCVTLGGGNLALDPEAADTKTFGVVVAPESVPGFTFSADYFDINVDGYIGSVDASIVINQCISEGVQFFCDLFHRDPTTGVLFGNEGYIVATNQNTGHLATTGVDFTATYGLDVGTWGKLNFDFIGTRLESRDVEQLPGLGTYDCKGLFGPTCGQPTPAWRHNLRAIWSGIADLAVSLNWRHFGSTRLASNSSNPLLHGDPVEINASLPAYNYIDLFGSWKARENLEIRMGVNNLFDKSPPAIAAGLLSAFGNGNTYPGVYDPMGRLVFAGMTFNF